MQEFKLIHLLLKLFEITISYHSLGINTLQCHFMYKNLKSFVSRCECVSCFDNILVVNPRRKVYTRRGSKKSLVLVFGSASIDLSFVSCILSSCVTDSNLFVKIKIKI